MYLKIGTESLNLNFYTILVISISFPVYSRLNAYNHGNQG